MSIVATKRVMIAIQLIYSWSTTNARTNKITSNTIDMTTKIILFTPLRTLALVSRVLCFSTGSLLSILLKQLLDLLG